jgi:GNAT superfamily N-acetyltransferase
LKKASFRFCGKAIAELLEIIGENMRFDVGCDVREFKEYWSRSGYDGNLDDLMSHVIKDSSQLIVWREEERIVGHSVWHLTNTEEHRKGEPRDGEDTEALRRLFGGKKDFVELHEIWLMKEHRGKGYGDMFHEFFEKFMMGKGYSDVVFYADHPAAIAICRKRGYKEGAYLKELKEHVFYLSLSKSSKSCSSSR